MRLERSRARLLPAMVLLCGATLPSFLGPWSQAAYADLLDEDEDVQVTPAPPKPSPRPDSPAPSSPSPAPSPGPANKPPADPASKPAPKTDPAASSSLAPKSLSTGRKAGAKSSGDEPVHFQSKGLKGLREKGMIELVESVIVTQGDLRMEADRARVFFDTNKKDVQRILAEGNVKIFKTDEDSGEKIKAFADRVTFENKERTVVLEGNARLWRGADLVRGDKITYEMATGWIRADRVAGEVYPESAKGQK